MEYGQEVLPAQETFASPTWERSQPPVKFGVHRERKEIWHCTWPPFRSVSFVTLTSSEQIKRYQALASSVCSGRLEHFAGHYRSVARRECLCTLCVLPTFFIQPCNSDSEMSFVDWTHGVGSSAKRDGCRGAVQHCHVSTFTVVTGIAQFECTVQLVIGLGSTHLPRRAERIWIDHRLCLPLLEKFVIEVRGELNLHLSSSGVMSQVICGHPGRFMLLWCRSSSVRFHRFRCGSPRRKADFGHVHCVVVDSV